MKKESKRAVSPIITTVLLVLIVLVLASLIVVWGTTFIPEKLSKFGSPIENGCDSVQFTATTQGSDIYIVNTGDIHLYKLGIRAKGAAKSTIEYEEVNLNPGGVKTISLSNIVGAEEVVIIPVLLGATDKDKIQEFSCTESSWKTIGL